MYHKRLHGVWVFLPFIAAQACFGPMSAAEEKAAAQKIVNGSAMGFQPHGLRY
jgi:hypothetical protein